MALQVSIRGRTSLNQGQRTTLTAAVNNPDGLNLMYAWTATRGSFVGATDEASAVFNANYLGEAVVQCAVTGRGGARAASLTAMNALGISGQLVNMFMTTLGAVSPNSNNALYQDGSVGTIAAGSDQVLSSDITIWRVRWNNSSNRIVLNNNQSGSLAAYFTANTDKSLYIIFEDGTYAEFPQSVLVSTGTTWAQWQVTDSNIIAKLNALTTTSDLVVGIADAGSVNIPSDSGVGRARIVTEVQPLSIEAIDEQFIVAGTADYDLVIDIGGTPDTAKATGHMEGFGQDWDAVNGQLHIKSQEVTRLINGVNWDIELVKGMETLMGQVAYNVVEAAPIFEALGTIHLYRGVPINFDIIIQNIPPLLIPDAELLGLKSELVAYGIKVTGEISATDTLAFSTGTVTIIVPSEGEGADTTYNYPYIIETGSPPQILSPVFRPKGRYGELEFADVTHALGYEWTLAEGDAATWTVFDRTRQVIHPDEVVVTPGTLEVTIQFPNIAGASSYEYMLESEAHTVDWTAFTGTLSGGFITTIIPDLQEGVQYTLRLRVSSPWQGTPISLTVYGGRFCYTLGLNSGDRDNQWLYIFHTGHPNGAQASRTKRLLLPTALSHPEHGGIAVNPDGDVFIVQAEWASSGEKAIYVFEENTIATAAEGSRLTQDRKYLFPSDAQDSQYRFQLLGLAEYEGKFYMYPRISSTAWFGFQRMSLPAADGGTLTREALSNRPNLNGGDAYGFSVTEESVWLKGRGARLYAYDRSDLSNQNAFTAFALRNADNSRGESIDHGLKVIENSVYNMNHHNDRLERFRVGSSAGAYLLDFSLSLPVGLSTPRFLDIWV